jgi:hypothetical protein
MAGRLTISRKFRKGSARRHASIGDPHPRKHSKRPHLLVEITTCEHNLSWTLVCRAHLCVAQPVEHDRLCVLSPVLLVIYVPMITYRECKPIIVGITFDWIRGRGRYKRTEQLARALGSLRTPHRSCTPRFCNKLSEMVQNAAGEMQKSW